jgi:plasmid stability protein
MKWLHLRVVNNLTEGTNKNGLRVRGKSQAPSRIDEHRNSLTPGRTTRNWVEVFREHELE